jgi:protoporphyrinogen oxidase
MIDMKKKVVILGAGLAGLTCANQLVKEGIEVTVLEKERFAGGLAASHTRAGFCYDFGPHRFYSNKEPVINFFKDLLKDNFISVERKSEIYMNDKFFLYPLVLSNITSRMPRGLLFRCSYDYLRAKMENIYDPDPKCTFESWVQRKYGRKMYEMFFRAYTEKVLGIESSKLSSDWAEQRISVPDLSTAIIHSLVKTKNRPRTLTSLFYYPREGGIGKVAELLRERILKKGGKILLNADVKEIKSTRFNRGKEIIQSVRYESTGQKYEEPLEYLMSTIPITDLLFLAKNNNLDLSICEKIQFRSILCFYLVLHYDHFTANHWIYLPERSFFSNRITEFKNFSPYNVPKDKTMICAEITCQYNDKKWNMPEEEMKDQVIDDIRKLGLKDVDQGAMADYFCHKVNGAYPIYALGYKDHIDAATRLLSSFHNLDCFGRNGLFKYGNMDDSIEMGLNAAEKYLRN